MTDREILAMLKNDCPMCGPADCACTATEQDQYREIQRLRLTGEEREAIRRAATWNEGVADDAESAGLHPEAKWHRDDAALLRALLERLG
jgi:hypothetical protein